MFPVLPITSLFSFNQSDDNLGPPYSEIKIFQMDMLLSAIIHERSIFRKFKIEDRIHQMALNLQLIKLSAQGLLSSLT